MIGSLSFGCGELRSECKRGKMGNMIESRNERSASTRTSINCVDVASPSSGNVGEDGLFDLGVRDRDCMSLSVLSGWNTCRKVLAEWSLVGK